MSFRPSLRLVLLALSAPCIVAAQEHPDLPSIGNGARAVGLGFATTAVADDIYAIGWNPAGLSYLTRREVAVASRFLFAGTSASATDPTPASYPKYSAAGEITGALDAIEFVGVALPYRVLGRTVAAGLAYRRFTEGVRVGTFETIRRQANGTYKGSTKYASTGGVRAISPSLGFEVTPQIRVGVTANLLTGSTIYTQRRPAPAPAYRTRELKHGGVALEAGALYRVSDALQFGLQVTLPHDRTLRWDNDTTIRDVTRKAPLAVAVGAVLGLSPTARVSADVRHSPWSGAEYLEDATGDTVATRVGKNDASSIHVGYERDREREIMNIYGVATGLLRTKQRLGLFARQSSVVDLKGRSIRILGISAGQSWLRGRGSVDLGLLYARSSQWTYAESSALRMELNAHDFVFSLALRRQF